MRLVRETTEKTWKIIVIACWDFMIREIRLIVLRALTNVSHALIAHPVFPAKEITGKLFH